METIAPAKGGKPSQGWNMRQGPKEPCRARHFPLTPPVCWSPPFRPMRSRLFVLFWCFAGVAAGQGLAANEAGLLPPRYPEVPAGQPKSVDGFLRRAWARYQAKDFTGALADYDEALKLDPKNVDAYAGRAVVHYHLRDGAEALADYSRAIALDPKNVDLYHGRGVVREAFQEWATAIEDFNRAIELNPKSATLWVRRAACKAGQNDFAGALTDLDRAAELDPKDADVFLQRGRTKELQKDLAGAISEYDRAVELDGKSALAYSARGFARNTKGDLEGAIADFGRVLELDPSDANARWYRGVSYYAVRNWEKSQADFEVLARDKEWTEYVSLYPYAILERSGKKEVAVKELKAWSERRTDAFPGDWLSTLSGFLLGEIPEDEMLMAAEKAPTLTRDWARTQAGYFAGLKRLGAGDQEGARKMFEKALSAGGKEFAEHQFCRAELKGLGK
jgi:tetratricopeptide (TPR) repeat protein